MKKKLLLILLAVMVCFAFTACGGSKDSSNSGQKESKGKLMMATTTSTEDTGLLDYLAPKFKKDTGYTLKWTAVGTGEALKLGEDGEVDVVLVHAKKDEEKFVKDGYGVKRYPVMYNDFVIVGPKKPIAKTADTPAVFEQIMDGRLPFVSRGDDSGTDKKEKSIWADLGLNPKDNPNYISAGQGMAETLNMANEKNAYCMTDRGTWLKQKNDSETKYTIDIVCENGKELKNQYGVIAVNPKKYPDVNNKAANAFIKWICSDKVQKLIGKYGEKEYGQPLFTPDAGTDN
ncbi:MAG: substrate-binding domain-containing protein [Anaerovoracaceae bacterium]|jgi:tungstate transport system substrate-binding protein